VREVVPEDQLQQANGLLAIARYAAFPLGAAIGGSIVALIGSGTALLVDAGTYAASAALLSRIDIESIARAGAGFLRELREGWSAFVEQTWVWVLVLYISMYFLITYAPFFVLGPYIAKHTMDGASSWAFVVTGEGVGSLLGGLAGLRWRPRQPMVFTGLLLMVSAVQNVLLAFHPTTLLLTPAATGAGFAFALGSVVWDTTLQRKVAPQKLARVASYGWMGAMVFLPAGYALAGPIATVIGLKIYLLVAAGWIVVSTLFVIRLRAVREVGLEEVTDAVAAPAQ
jgi:predicted MFS family arabinose efflux permease